MKLLHRFLIAACEPWSHEVQLLMMLFAGVALGVLVTGGGTRF